ncbi:MAG: transcriptional repressor [Candidatus Moduliflexus flocculans]|nr:transcriptional repressor [Candidatus Moduliflexus flocculans]
MASSLEHPDADAVFRAVRKRVPTVSIDTVYRTLWMLNDLGLVTTLGPRRESVRFDANLDQPPPLRLRPLRPGEGLRERRTGRARACPPPSRTWAASSPRRSRCGASAAAAPEPRAGFHNAARPANSTNQGEPNMAEKTKVLKKATAFSNPLAIRN